MTKRKKRRGSSDNYNRFCVECGLHPPPRQTGYTRGQCVKWGGYDYAVVFCVRCRKIELTDNDWELKDCRHCRKRRIDIQRKEEDEQRRVRRKIEREAWHRRTKEIWGSDTSSCGEFDDTDNGSEAIWFFEEDGML